MSRQSASTLNRALTKREYEHIMVTKQFNTLLISQALSYFCLLVSLLFPVAFVVPTIFFGIMFLIDIDMACNSHVRLLLSRLMQFCSGLVYGWPVPLALIFAHDTKNPIDIAYAISCAVASLFSYNFIDIYTAGRGGAFGSLFSIVLFIACIAHLCALAELRRIDRDCRL